MEWTSLFRLLSLVLRPLTNTTVYYSEVNYTTIWNALDYPVAVLPVTTVDPVIDIKQPPHKFLSEADKRVYELCSSTIWCHFVEHYLIYPNLALRWTSSFRGHTHSTATGRTNPGRRGDHRDGRNCRRSDQENASVYIGQGMLCCLILYNKGEQLPWTLSTTAVNI